MYSETHYAQAKNGLTHPSRRRLKLFSTSPQSLNADARTYRQQLTDVARWSERAGCSGILVYTDNGIVDPWLVSQIIVESTETLAPLVAVQPVYMHPYAVAKMVASFAFIYHRRIFLNMVAGGFTNDLAALSDRATHDERYARLIEYSLIIKRLAEAKEPLTFDGAYYKTDKLVLKPAVPADLLPGIFVSGSSAAGAAAAASIGATAVKYPEPPTECENSTQETIEECGLRVGIIARDRSRAAWSIAHQRFPADRKGQLVHQLAMRVSDSAWHKQLSDISDTDGSLGPYWLGPFNNSKSNCPYLVGDYDEVAAGLRQYIQQGYSTFILDIPPSEEDLHHTGIVFQKALGEMSGQVV